jgi:hypothetical protein
MLLTALKRAHGARAQATIGNKIAELISDVRHVEGRALLWSRYHRRSALNVPEVALAQTLTFAVRRVAVVVGDFAGSLQARVD